MDLLILFFFVAGIVLWTRLLDNWADLAKARHDLETEKAKLEEERERVIAAFNRFVGLWNAGVKEEAIDSLKQAGLRVEEKTP